MLAFVIEQTKSQALNPLEIVDSDKIICQKPSYQSTLDVTLIILRQSSCIGIEEWNVINVINDILQSKKFFLLFHNKHKRNFLIPLGRQKFEAI